jgi:hypothetical protein
MEEWHATSNTCDGCDEDRPCLDLLLYYDILGVGFFDKKCLSQLKAGERTPKMIEAKKGPAFLSPTDKHNPFLEKDLDQIKELIGQVLIDRKDSSFTDPFPITKKYTPQQQSFSYSMPQCDLGYQYGHFNKIAFNGTKGGVIVSSSRVGLIDETAQAALFFDSAWKSANSFKVEMKNNESGVIPNFSSTAATIPTAFIPWADMKAPHPNIVPYVKWAVELVNNGGWLQIGCIGGHGRTGTFLALMLLESGRAANATEAVTKARGLYCDKAIETMAQADFIYAHVGEPTPTTKELDSIQPYKQKKASKAKPPVSKKASTKPPTYKVPEKVITRGKKDK